MGESARYAKRTATFVCLLFVRFRIVTGCYDIQNADRRAGGRVCAVSFQIQDIELFYFSCLMPRSVATQEEGGAKRKGPLVVQVTCPVGAIRTVSLLAVAPRLLQTVEGKIRRKYNKYSVLMHVAVLVFVRNMVYGYCCRLPCSLIGYLDVGCGLASRPACIADVYIVADAIL